MIRRKRRKHRRFVFLGGFALVVLLLASALVFSAFSSNRRPHPDVAGAKTTARATVRPALDRHPSQPVYPYSVIRGGVYSVEEFDAALRRDSVASAHYSGFHRESLRMAITQKPAELYASYRIGNAVYWTSHRVHIAAGEGLITDGTNWARARCGNQLSDSPREPVSRMEPMEREMEAPEAVDFAEPPAADPRVLDRVPDPHPPPPPGSKLVFEIFPPEAPSESSAYSGPSGNSPPQPAWLWLPSSFGPASASPSFVVAENTLPPGDEPAPLSFKPDRQVIMNPLQSKTAVETVPEIPRVTPPVFPGVITGMQEFPDDNPRIGGGPWSATGNSTTTTSGSTPISGNAGVGETAPPGANPNSSGPGAHAVPEPVAGALVCAGLAFLCIAAKRLIPDSH